MPVPFLFSGNRYLNGGYKIGKKTETKGKEKAVYKRADGY